MWPLAGGVLALVLAVWLVRLRRTLTVVTISGESMQPTYSDGDRVLVRRVRLDKLRNGQVVVIEKPDWDGEWHTPPPSGPGGSGEWIIKRVVALPGDHWPTPSQAAPSGSGSPARTFEPFARPASASAPVPAGNFVVQGDNPLGSYDSRIFGYCPAERLLGVVVRSLEPARPRLSR